MVYLDKKQPFVFDTETRKAAKLYEGDFGNFKFLVDVFLRYAFKIL